eukprot:scaffold473_cov257-Pinguiococcus_pyrenoidosus.AAC.9
MCPTRRKDGATRQVIAVGSRMSVSGSELCERMRSMNALRMPSGRAASLGSFSLISAPRSACEYHARRTVSSCDTTSDSARVVSTPRWNMASEARNSRMLDRNTALPSAPRQNGVFPAPFSCISQRFPSTTTSPMLMARPSP